MSCILGAKPLNGLVFDDVEGTCGVIKGHKLLVLSINSWRLKKLLDGLALQRSPHQCGKFHP
jgi:hypothetical protein